MKIRKKTPASQLIDDTGIPARPGWLLAGLCLAGAAKAIEPPFEVFYPPTAAPFGAGWSLAHFLSSSSAILLVLFMLGGGIMGDLYGRRKFLLWGMLAMLVANILLLLSVDTLWHVVWRVLAFLSSGVVFPLTLAPIYVFFEARQRGIAFAIYLTCVAIAGLLAAYQGRLFSGLLDWRGAYLIPGLLSIAAILIVYRNLPESRSANPRLMDVIVHAGWTVLVLAVLYTFFETGLGREWLIIVLIVAGLALAIGLALIIWWVRKTRGNLLRTAVIHTRHVTILIVSGVIVQIALLGVYSLAYSYYRVGQNLNFTQTLVSLMPMFLGMISAVLLIARIWAYRQVRRVVATGFLLVSVAIFGLAAAARLPYWVQIFPLVLFGVSILVTKTVWTNAFFQTLLDRYIGLNAGINSATLLVGGALGGFLTTELLAYFGQSAFVRQTTSLTLSAGALKDMYNNISAVVSAGEQAGLSNLARTISTNLYSQYQSAYITGYSLTMLVIAVLCLLVALLIILGIRVTLKFRPEYTPLNDHEPGEPSSDPPTLALMPGALMFWRAEIVAG